MDARCPVCSTLYDLRQLEVIQDEEGTTLLYIKCAVCQSAALSVVSLGPMGIRMSSILTDLEQHEVMRFQDVDALASGEVLELHEALNKGGITFNQL